MGNRSRGRIAIVLLLLVAIAAALVLWHYIKAASRPGFRADVAG